MRFSIAPALAFVLLAAAPFAGCVGGDPDSDAEGGGDAATSIADSCASVCAYAVESCPGLSSADLTFGRVDVRSACTLVDATGAVALCRERCEAELGSQPGDASSRLAGYLACGVEVAAGRCSAAVKTDVFNTCGQEVCNTADCYEALHGQLDALRAAVVEGEVDPRGLCTNARNAFVAGECTGNELRTPEGELVNCLASCCNTSPCTSAPQVGLGCDQADGTISCQCLDGAGAGKVLSIESCDLTQVDPWSLCGE